MAYGVVYYIVNTINGKMYVGQTKNFKKRIRVHKSSDQYVDRVIQKYGWKNFRCGVIKICASKAEMDKWEKFFIIALNTKSNGYNLTDGGEGIVGLERTPEHNAKISASLMGKPLSSEHCANISAGQRDESPFKNLIAEINKCQFTYTKLAEILGLPQQAVSEKMHGNQNFTMSQVDKLVKFFGKPKEYLFARDDGLPAKLSKRHQTLFKNLLDAIIKQGFSYTSLAKILRLAQQTFFARMCGKTNFTERDKTKLAEIFGKPIDYLMFKEKFL